MHKSFYLVSDLQSSPCISNQHKFHTFQGILHTNYVAENKFRHFTDYKSVSVEWSKLIITCRYWRNAITHLIYDPVVPRGRKMFFNNTPTLTANKSSRLIKSPTQIQFFWMHGTLVLTKHILYNYSSRYCGFIGTMHSLLAYSNY